MGGFDGSSACGQCDTRGAWKRGQCGCHSGSRRCQSGWCGEKSATDIAKAARGQAQKARALAPAAAASAGAAPRSAALPAPCAHACAAIRAAAAPARRASEAPSLEATQKCSKSRMCTRAAASSEQPARGMRTQRARGAAALLTRQQAGSDGAPRTGALFVLLTQQAPRLRPNGATRRRARSSERALEVVPKSSRRSEEHRPAARAARRHQRTARRDAATRRGRTTTRRAPASRAACRCRTSC